MEILGILGVPVPAAFLGADTRIDATAAIGSVARLIRGQCRDAGTRS